MELAPEDLLRTVDRAYLAFASTADIEPLEEPIAQERAREAVDFGVGMRFPGYNLYALGSAQTDKRALVVDRLKTLSAAESVPSDWCYLQNFDDPARPISVQLPGGQGRRFRRDMQTFIANVRSMIPLALASDEYAQERQVLASSFQQRQSSDAAALEAEAREVGLMMLPTPRGFVFAPVQDGKVMEQEAFLALSQSERKKLQDAISTMTDKLVERMRDYPQYEQQLVEQQRELKRKTADKVLSSLLARLRSRYQTNAKLMLYLSAVREELLENVERIVALEQPSPRASMFPSADPESFFDRFKVNLIVDRNWARSFPNLH